ncbi:hypothetical protein [Kribbella qitaiheensis]|uniref:hypothetical protein n=1 Tax=Kribbella qitaiheensis TaxID=1544730 RepID=UPI0019D5FC1D|nr:hypothetical protein [Kribbella qitaiheensis]
MLHDLERLIGPATMAALLRSYAKANWYSVATRTSFKSAAQTSTAIDLGEFWTTHTIP